MLDAINFITKKLNSISCFLTNRINVNIITTNAEGTAVEIGIVTGILNVG